MTGCSSASSNKFIDITSMPVFVDTGNKTSCCSSSPTSLDFAFSVSRNVFGIDGPVMSASKIAVFLPFRWDKTARRDVTSDLPTPPFPLTTAIIFLISEKTFGSAAKLDVAAFPLVRDAQFEPQVSQLCVQFSED